MTTTRPSTEEVLMATASLWATRSTCVRRKVGCVIADPSLETFVVGYNGQWRGGPNTCIGPNKPGQCGCLHAEVNAIAKAGRGPKIAFITLQPCRNCAILLVNAGVEHVWYRDQYPNKDGLAVLESSGITYKELRTEWIIFESIVPGSSSALT